MRAPRRRLGRLAALTAAAAVAVGGGLFGAAPASAADPSPGTASATAGQVDLDMQLLGGLLGALHLSGPNGLDVPLANLVLGQASAPGANGDAANFSNSVLRLRDDLLNTLHLPAASADLLKADVASGTARVITGPGGYTQAYATVANLRLFLPLLNLPGADAANGILKIDAVSAQATCQPGKAPSASAKMPTTVLLLGHSIPVPLTGDIPLDIGVAKLDVHLAPVTTTGSAGASAAVEARISIDAIGLAKVSGAIILASAKCTSPDVVPAANSSGSGTQSSGSQQGAANTAAGTPSGGQTTALGAQPAAAANQDGALAATGANGSTLPIAITAVALVAAGAGLLVFLRKKASRPPEG